MQNADQREKAPGRVKIHVDLAGQAILQGLRALIMEASPAHIDCLDLRGRRRLDRVIIAFADQEIVLDDLAEGREREQHLAMRLAIFEADVENETIFFDGQVKDIRPALAAYGCEVVFFQQVENGDLALMLDIRAAAHDGTLIKNEIDNAEARAVTPRGLA